MAVTFPFLNYIGQETSVLAERDVFLQLNAALNLPLQHGPVFCCLLAFNILFYDGLTCRIQQRVLRKLNKNKHRALKSSEQFRMETVSSLDK